MRRLILSSWSRVLRSHEIEDLTQAAALGLMDAARRFEPDRGLKFWTFARTRVLGAALDYIRTIYGRRNQKVRPLIEADMPGDDEEQSPMALVVGRPDDSIETQVGRVRVRVRRRLCEFVPARTAQMLLMRVFDRMTFRAIAEAFDLTESRICQMLTDDLVDRARGLVENEVAREVAV